MDENIQFIKSQIEIAKRMNVVAVPSALIHGKVWLNELQLCIGQDWVE